MPRADRKDRVYYSDYKFNPGYWVLGTGYWVLGTGYWVLGTRKRTPTLNLCQQFFHHVPVDVRQTEMPALVLERQPLMVDA